MANFRGPVSLRTALQNSLNVASVKVYQFAGKIRFADMASALGLQFPEDSLITLSSALGANEVSLYDMMGAYGALANAGRLNATVRRLNGSPKPLMAKRSRSRVSGRPPPRLFRRRWLIWCKTCSATMPPASPSFQSGSALTLASIGIPTQNTVAAKTGTSNGARDLWTMGFTRNAVVGVWLGTSDNSPTYNTSGIRSAAPVWNAVMTAAARQKAPLPIDNPGGVVVREICRATGTLNFDTCQIPARDSSSTINIAAS